MGQGIQSGHRLDLLESPHRQQNEVAVAGLLEFGRDEKSGAYVFRSSSAGAHAPAEHIPEIPAITEITASAETLSPATRARGRGRSRAGTVKSAAAPADQALPILAAPAAEPAAATDPARKPATRSRRPRKPKADAT